MLLRKVGWEMYKLFVMMFIVVSAGLILGMFD
jgi:hypothetical protein